MLTAASGGRTLTHALSSLRSLRLRLFALVKQVRADLKHTLSKFLKVFASPTFVLVKQVKRDLNTRSKCLKVFASPTWFESLQLGEGFTKKVRSLLAFLAQGSG